MPAMLVFSVRALWCTIDRYPADYPELQSFWLPCFCDAEVIISRGGAEEHAALRVLCSGLVVP